MELLVAIMVGVLVAAAVHLMLARNVLRFLFGLILISNAANLTIFVSGRLTSESPPLIPEGDYAPLADAANALPQALVLTAIVIGFGLFAFALTLVYRTYQNLGTLNSDEMRLAEPVEDTPSDPSKAYIAYEADK
ncbi:cation:proton antiporter [Jannaschia sp. EhC01]|uniref:Na+/H+ antiporter subunit C n=1 Tax=Gymnodinialimonas phycosphaerae TaxID=2841589 RepID=A0A975YED5_9RHOB|nr:Na+/H+ antiporter subunit C [Gymnodinialimonas phycosphaerae]MBY4893475.1 Na+/H+ antiporter subunit C [Gymnodinialimonas phycosphaerae]OAN76270.1 cation:proton antiporter [Jannaschia sp. EhC01]